MQALPTGACFHELPTRFEALQFLASGKEDYRPGSDYDELESESSLTTTGVVSILTAVRILKTAKDPISPGHDLVAGIQARW